MSEYTQHVDVDQRASTDYTGQVIKSSKCTMLEYLNSSLLHNTSGTLHAGTNPFSKARQGTLTDTYIH